MERRSGVSAATPLARSPVPRDSSVIWRPRRRPSQHDLGPARRRVLRVVPSCTSVATDDARHGAPPGTGRRGGPRQWRCPGAAPCLLGFGGGGWPHPRGAEVSESARLPASSYPPERRARGASETGRARALRRNIKISVCRVHRFRDLALGHEHYVCRRARGRCFRFLVHL